VARRRESELDDESSIARSGRKRSMRA
jgi:hypothetical protein